MSETGVAASRADVMPLHTLGRTPVTSRSYRQGRQSMLRLSMDPELRRSDAGRTLWRAEPFWQLSLSAQQGHMVDRWAAGEPVDASDPAQELAQRLLAAGVVHPIWQRVPAGPADVTVVIPVRDRAALLESLVAALGDVAEVVIVDDGSRVPVEGARVRHEHPRGPAAARNAGWRLATTDLVAFVDSDCLPQPGWLDHLVPHFADPQVAAAAPRIVSAAGPSVLARYERTRAPHDLGSAPGAVRPRTRVPYVSSTLLLARRAALADVGGFSEDMHFGEDLDLVFRLAAAGSVVRYEPSAVATHLPRTRLKPWMRQRYSYGTTDAPLLSRHPGSMTALTASAWSAAAWSLAAARRFRPAGAVALGSVALTCWQLQGLAPPGESLRLGGQGHLTAGQHIASALSCKWWPISAAAAVLSPSARRVAAAAVLTCYLDEWRECRPQLGILPWCSLRLLDDLCYGTGVWAGCIRYRTVAPLVPDLHGLPGLPRRL
jgi:mycofactocin system glycosyltransferase